MKDLVQNVLICGSNYARTYAAAAALTPSEYRVVGVLARGSDRSVALAASLQVPLFRSPVEVPDGIDLACSATGSDAFGVSLELLRRGIPVLCEHPLREHQIRLGLEAATTFQVNPHFAYLPAPRAFIEAARACSDEVVWAEILAPDRGLYGAVDIVARVLDGEPSVLRTVDGGPVRPVSTTWGATPAVFGIEPSKRDGRVIADGSQEYLFDMRITLAFATGVLTMASIAGPVFWNANYASSLNTGEPLWREIHAQAQTGYELNRRRIEANLYAMAQTVATVRTGSIPTDQTPPFLLRVARAWQALGSA